jgi:hypothetical protein
MPAGHWGWPSPPQRAGVGGILRYRNRALAYAAMPWRRVKAPALLGFGAPIGAANRRPPIKEVLYKEHKN